MSTLIGTRAALITGKEAVIAVRRPAPALRASGADGRLNHSLQGPRVKAPAYPPTGINKQGLRDAWAAFLSPIPFQWFATLTFERNVHPEAAYKRYRRFTNEINRDIYGRRWEKLPSGGIYWVVANERQKRGVVHLHALMGDANDLNQIARRLSWMDRWHEMAGIARIEAVRSDEATIRYVTKYVIKDGEIEFSKNLGEVAQLSLINAAK